MVVMRKLAFIHLLALVFPVLGENYRFSAGCFDDRRGIVAFTQKIDGKLYLVLNDLERTSKKQIEINQKSSAPTVCGEAVAICYYGDGKIILYNYELQPVSEVVLGKGISPFYSACGSDGRFLYVYVVQFDNGPNLPRKFIYKYRWTEGNLTLDGSSSVEAVGTIVTYRDSVFVVNEKSCKMVTFAK